MFRAWQPTDTLRELRTLPLFQDEAAINEWPAWASRSRLAPFVTLARTVRHSRTSVGATIEWKLTNEITESNSTGISRIRSATRGFHAP